MKTSLLFLDLETTGPDPVKDRIVSLGFLDSDDPGKPSEWLINPERPIPAEATAVHGITDDMVKDAPPFRHYAKVFMAIVRGRNLSGFNVLGFDIPLLWQEFFRADGTCWDLSGIAVVDSERIYKFKESRKLDDAVQLYAPELADLRSHNAGNDCVRAAGVLAGQLRKYPDLDKMTTAELARFCQGDTERIDAIGWLVRDKQGRIVYSRGQMRDKVATDPQNIGCASWLMGKDFVPDQTKFILRQVLDGKIR